MSALHQKADIPWSERLGSFFRLHHQLFDLAPEQRQLDGLRIDHLDDPSCGDHNDCIRRRLHHLAEVLLTFSEGCLKLEPIVILFRYLKSPFARPPLLLIF